MENYVVSIKFKINVGRKYKINLYNVHNTILFVFCNNNKIAKE